MTMTRLIITSLLLLTSIASAKNTKYRDILRDRQKLRQFYENFKNDLRVEFKGKEDRGRFKIFKQNLELVAAENEVDGEPAEFTVNKFALLTPEERLRWISNGLRNVTEWRDGLGSKFRPPVRRKRSSIPKEWFWTDENYVTQVQDQGWCASCWAFSAAATLETNYAIATGVLRKFSEQEAVDCSFEDRPVVWHPWVDSCDGGWPLFAFEYAMKHKRWGSATDYPPYTEEDNTCNSSQYGNGLRGAHIVDVSHVGPTEVDHIEALLSGAVSVAYHVTDRFYLYERGIYKDVGDTCTADAYPNHAVAMVGYAPGYFLVKNSWGVDWGDRGFVKFLRGYHNCGLLHHSSIPVLATSGLTDGTEGDTPTKYNPRHSEPSDDCVDERDDCELHLCFDETVSYEGCRRTCHTCDVDFEAEAEARAGGECGNNLIRCDYDGICRHRHICRWVEFM